MIKEGSVIGQGNTMNLSFAGCGFLGIYHVGVASCIREYAPHLYVDKIAGASAGAIAAAGLITNCCLGEATTYVLKIAQQARARALGPLHPSFDIVKILREGLNVFLPENAHEICSGRLHVSLTRVADRENVIISEFESKEDLIQVLICSAFIPFYCGILPPKHKGVRYVDGGLSNNIPILNEHTLTVSPFAGESDICPTDNSANDLHMFLVNTSIQFTMRNFCRMAHVFFPVPPEELTQMCRQGFDDTLKFLQKNGLISCTRHLSIHSSIVTSEEVEQLQKQRQRTSYDLDLIEEDDMVDHFAANHHRESCVECKSRQHAALLDTLPPSVIGALQAACDSVNSGVLAPVYNMAAFRVLSIMAAPCYLPLELGIVLGKRVWEWAPYMPSDIQWFVQELAMFLTQAVEYIQTHRHKYSARFTCQLAITDLDYSQETTMYSSVHSLAGTPLHTPHQTPMVRRRETISARQRNLNVGISVDFQSHYNNPIDCVDELRQKLIEGAAVSHIEEFRKETFGSDSDSIVTDMDSTTSQYGSEPKLSLPRSRRPSHCSQVGDTAYDTFEHCLQKANEMESVLAFYYQDDNNPNLMKVTEIFSIDEGHHHGRSRSSSKHELTGSRQDLSGSMHDLRSSKHDLSRTPSSELEWDSFVENRHGNIVSVDVK